MCNKEENLWFALSFECLKLDLSRENFVKAEKDLGIEME
jgi:hypothetical protein